MTVREIDEPLHVLGRDTGINFGQHVLISKWYDSRSSIVQTLPVLG